MKPSGHGQIEHTQLIGSTDRSVGQSSDGRSQENGGQRDYIHGTADEASPHHSFKIGNAWSILINSPRCDLFRLDRRHPLGC